MATVGAKGLIAGARIFVIRALVRFSTKIRTTGNFMKFMYAKRARRSFRILSTAYKFELFYLPNSNLNEDIIIIMVEY